MRVICPHNTLLSETEQALRTQAPHAEFVDVSADVTDYWRLLADLWSAQEDFCVVEHDVVIGPGTIGSFEDCPELWCACGDPSWGNGAPQLQCVRFRAELLEKLPEALDLPPWGKHWAMQDQFLLPRLRRAGISCHMHPETTRHLSTSKGAASQAAFYAWLAQFATFENEQLLIDLPPGLERDRLALAFLLAPLAKFLE